MVPANELSCTGIVEPILVDVAIDNVLGMGVTLDVVCRDDVDASDNTVDFELLL